MLSTPLVRYCPHEFIRETNLAVNAREVNVRLTLNYREVTGSESEQYGAVQIRVTAEVVHSPIVRNSQANPWTCVHYVVPC